MRRLASAPFCGRGFIAGVVTALLAACGNVTVGPTNLDRYQPTDTSLFTGNGQLVLVGGGDADREALAAVAAKNVAKGAMGRSGLLLTPNAGDRPVANNRVVVVVGGGNPYALCESAPAGGTLRRGEPLSVVAAACNGSRRLSSTSGRVDAPVSGPEDPQVAALFRAIGAELFPPETPEQRQDRGDGPGDWND